MPGSQHSGFYTVRILLMMPLLSLCTVEWSILHSVWWDIEAVPPRSTFAFCVLIFQLSKKGLEIKMFFQESEKYPFLSVVRCPIAWLSKNRFTLMCWQNFTWLNLFAALSVLFWIWHHALWAFLDQRTIPVLWERDCIRSHVASMWEHRAEWIIRLKHF